MKFLGHVMALEDRRYFYDGVNGEIYECDEAVARLLAAGAGFDDATERDRLREELGGERFETALRELASHAGATGGLVLPELGISLGCPSCHDESSYSDRIGHLQLTVSEQCNLRCGYCPYSNDLPWSRPHADSHMSLETALAAADFFLARCKNAEDPVISFYGGEPLLQFRLIQEVVYYVRSQPGGERIRFIVDTNGVLLSEEIAEFLADDAIHVQVSLDGPRHIHDRYRRTRSGKGSHSRVLDGVKRLLERDRSAHKRLRFNAVMAPPYDPEAVVDYFTDFPVYAQLGIAGHPSVALNVAGLSGFSFRPRDVTDPRTCDIAWSLRNLRRRYMDACLEARHHELGPALRSLFDGDLITFHKRNRQPLTGSFFPTGSCQPGQRKVHVRSDGFLMPCERGGDELIIGHVARGFDFGAIAGLYEGLLGSVAERCRTCWALRVCAVCFIHLAPLWKRGKPVEPKVPELVCEEIRRSRSALLRDYVALLNSNPQNMQWLDDAVVK